MSIDQTYDVSLPEFNTLTEMAPGDGYLLYATEAVTLTYPEVAGGGAEGLAVPGAGGGGCDALSPTPYATLVYGYLQLNGTAAPPGTVVEVLTPRGDVAGCCVVATAGQFGLMHVYGEDATATPVIPGFRAGEALAFRVNGMPVDAPVAVLWSDDKAPHEVTLEATIHSTYLPVVRRLFP